MDESRQMVWILGGLLFVGTLVIAATSCESDGPDESDAPYQASSSAESTGADETDESSAGEAPNALPGDKKAGERRPKSPGPEGAGLFFLSGLKGYLEPCGCTADVLLGGAERIVGYVESARERYSETLMVDGGDTFFEKAEVADHLVSQKRANADVIAAMHRKMETRAMVPGERDFALGAELYKEKVEAVGAELLGANVNIAGEALPATTIEEVGDWRIAVVGAVQPNLFEEIEGVETSPAGPAVGDAIDRLDAADVDATVVLFHGGLKGAKELLGSHPAIDFTVVGHEPREPGGADEAGDGHTLEAYDQGRYVGALKLFGAGRSRPFVNARPGSESDLSEIDDKIAHVEESLEEVPKGEAGEKPPPIRRRLRERLERLEERRSEIEGGDLEVSEEYRSFLFRPVAMKPGFPISADIREKRVAYNRKLKELTKQADRKIPEVDDGEATYVGTNQCKTCHTEAHDFWTGTHHADAMETLETRDKAWDARCVKCHVVGYDEPGGSIVGKLEYEADIRGESIRKNLRDVGCESCHGPGSKHRSQPVGGDGNPQHIESGADPSVCKECHVKGHSPRFNYETYVRRVTGEGHELRSESN